MSFPFKDRPRYHSAFGGLWVDRLDADQEFIRRRADNAFPPLLAAQIAGFMADGYAIVPGAVDPGLADRIAGVMTSAYADGNPRLRYQTDGADTYVLGKGVSPRGSRIVEAHAVLPEVRDAFASVPIVVFLNAIFDEAPVLSQSLMFQMGSEQRFHRDTTFVRFDQPLCMVGCWIALEDVRPGSGELGYIAGSHRLPDFPFSNGRKDGVHASPAELDQSLQWIVTESEKRGLVRQVFRAKKGDALIWHADLAHGGLAITAPSLTRQSVVGHLSPASVGRSAHRECRWRRRHGPITYTSTYYDLREGVRRYVAAALGRQGNQA